MTGNGRSPRPGADRRGTARRVLAAAALFALAGPARADTVEARCDIVAEGAARASVTLPCRFAQRQGVVTIERADGVRHELTPRGATGRYVDSDGRAAYRRRGLGDRGLIFRLAHETVVVHWDRPGPAGSAEAIPPTTPAAAAPTTGSFERTLEWQGIRMRVTCRNDSSLNRLEIVPEGLEFDHRPIVREIDGTVDNSKMADLDADGSPELYVYLRSAGSGSYGSLVAYAVNRRRSLSEITLPPITDHPTAARGYQGHDEFAVGEGRLLRRFPVYRPDDPNVAPSGGTRQLQYRLEPGEAGWQLRIDRVVEY